MFRTRTFEYEGGVAVILPDDFGFKPGDDIVMIKVGSTIYILHADAPEEEIDRLLAMSGPIEPSETVISEVQ